jgi:hypothetical protein
VEDCFAFDLCLCLYVLSLGFCLFSLCPVFSMLSLLLCLSLMLSFRYGLQCYQKNPAHKEKFRHPLPPKAAKAPPVRGGREAVTDKEDRERQSEGQRERQRSRLSHCKRNLQKNQSNSDIAVTSSAVKRTSSSICAFSLSCLVCCRHPRLPRHWRRNQRRKYQLQRRDRWNHL